MTLNSSIIFGGRFIRVHAAIADMGDVVVCFDAWHHAPSLDGEPFGLQYLTSNNINVVSVKCARNDWYQNDEILKAIEVIDAHCGSRGRIGYGSSMGAYAALNFSRHLSFRRVVAFAPQFSMDQKKAPWEDRWREDMKNVPFTFDEVETSSTPSGILMLDPMNVRDRLNAEKILETHNLRLVSLPFAGHIVLSYLGQTPILGKHLPGMLLSGAPDIRSFIEDIRDIRSSHSTYWSQIGAAHLKRRRYELALDAVDRARKATFGEKVYAEILMDDIASLLRERDRRAAFNNYSLATK
ncbi:alpha/beta hydrolase [Rhizobium sp. WW_1]|jgi:hypothetical protein|uniref:alpha/beta hydrolase n=1 Tax=Rhizobium sp. WW_1 TaxID=1907375 RepID=UPI000647798E|nr:alpha/beta hydrolase [Rhizobium sp. WW_1]RKD68962.1 hypothetical protein BJ928_104100 [Rhizobium sp. WW_1]